MTNIPLLAESESAANKFIAANKGGQKYTYVARPWDVSEWPPKTVFYCLPCFGSRADYDEFRDALANKAASLRNLHDA